MAFSTRTVCPFILLFGLSGPALSQAPDYDFQWKTIGAPGNVAASPEDFPFLDINGLGPTGRVDYAYRMSQTEVTVGQWFEFVNAYAPYAKQKVVLTSFTGRHIYSATGDPSNPQFTMYPGTEKFAGEMTWHNAARYCNWLHNGKINEAWAFESGAYDASTFVQTGNGTWLTQETRSPGAKYWIPSLNEWTKGMYYDPHKYGPDQPGYWLYPVSSDAPPIPGAPGTPGAQTGAGWYPGKFEHYEVNVGSYPLAQSPWGLLDGSGGSSEWTEWTRPGFGLRVILGSNTSMSDGYDQFDQIGVRVTSWPETAIGIGFRICSVVPCPSTMFPFAVFFLACRRRNR